MAIIVKTKQELTEAINNKESDIIVRGELVKEIKKTVTFKKIKYGGLIGLGAGAAAAIAAAPFTAGTSLAVFAASAAATTGLSTTAIIAALAIGGLTIAWAIQNNYEMEFKKDKDGNIEVIIKRKL